jgi:hypothetical protein
MVIQEAGYQSAKRAYGVQNSSISIPIRTHLRLHILVDLASFLVQPLSGQGPSNNGLHRHTAHSAMAIVACWR